MTENNFTNDLKSKLVGIATNADVTNENNAATATKLATARTIAGQSFDGSANIAIALSDLSNVHTTAPSNNQVLTWDATNSRWAPADASGSTLPTASDSTLGGIKVGTNLSIDGNGVLSASNSILTHNITIGDVGGNKYLFNNDTSEPQPTITLIKGMTYYFSLNISGHPFHLQTSGNGYNSSNSYTSHSSYISGYLTHSSGVSDGNAQGKTSGILTFSVPYNAPDTLYYQCQYHSGMYGIFNIVNGSTLPTASDSTLGGIKVGTNLSIDSNGVLSATDTNTTYIVGNGGLTENNFTNDLKSKLVGIATNADVYKMKIMQQLLRN